jgi:hypothetical protein
MNTGDQEHRSIGVTHLLDLVRANTICESGKLELDEKSSVHQPVRATITASPPGLAQLMNLPPIS